MTRERFLQLAGQLFDACAAEHRSGGGTAPATTAPSGNVRAPLYDCRVRCKDGYKRASEMTADDLAWWLQRTEASVASGSKYAEKDAKLAKNLRPWLNWRSANPLAPWSGESNHQRVTVPAPPQDPNYRAPVHAWEPRTTAAAEPAGAAFADEPDESEAAEADADAAACANDDDPF